MRFSWQTGMILGVAVVVVATLALQRQASDQVRGEIALVAEQNREIARLKSEQLKLQASQPSAKDLESMRSDHAAVARLRSEVEAMETRVRAMEKDQSP